MRPKIIYPQNIFLCRVRYIVVYMDNNEVEIIDKKTILKELNERQLKNVQVERKLHFKDLRRITKYIDSSIFDENKCCMWNGYVTNETNTKRGTYVNFFFRNKKVALHRLLYENFIGPLGDDSYLKFSCEENGADGKCCNVQHMIKYKYNNTKEEDNDGGVKDKKSKCKSKGASREFVNTDLKIIFD